MARPRSSEPKVETVVRVPVELHPFRAALPQGLHQIAIARQDLFAKLATLPRSSRPLLKLRLTLDERRRLEEIANSTRRPIWLVVTVALICVRDAPAGIRSAALSENRKNKAKNRKKTDAEMSATDASADDSQLVARGGDEHDAV